MDGVAAARSQQAGSLLDNSGLGLRRLYGEHGFTHHQIGASIRQAGAGGVGHHILGLGVGGDHLGNRLASLRVWVDAGVRLGVCL